MASQWEKKMDMWHWAFQHRQLESPVQEGRSMWLQETHLEKSLLIYSLSNKGPSFPQGPEDQNGLAAVRSISGSQRKFICSFIHSFQKCKFRSLLPMWASYLLSKWPNSNLSGDKSPLSLLKHPKHRRQGSWAKSSTFIHTRCESSRKWPSPPVFKAKTFLPSPQ